MSKPARRPHLRIGISGWRYPPWRGVFYPEKWPQHRELEFASRQLNSIEINGSFYSLQLPDSYRAWHDATPDDFVFAVKGGRFITHMKKLRDVRVPLANFFASGVLALKGKLGPFLWQFPPNMRFDEKRFAEFFELLPRTGGDAANLARGHDARLNGRALVRAHDPRFLLRHAVEIRHQSFRTSAFIKLLREHDVALVFADTARRWPYFEDLTSDFVYLRLHGDEELYVSGYTDTALDHWARRIELWSCGRQPADAKLVSSSSPRRVARRDVYVYFDNDVKVRAPIDAISLSRRLGIACGTMGGNTNAPHIALQREGLPGERWRARGRLKSLNQIPRAGAG
jgi:uncharacterized protein YecE (DUF72 family)